MATNFPQLLKSYRIDCRLPAKMTMRWFGSPYFVDNGIFKIYTTNVFIMNLMIGPDAAAYGQEHEGKKENEISVSSTVPMLQC